MTKSQVNAVTKAEGELNTATMTKKEAAQQLVEAQSGEERRLRVQADLTRLEAIENQVGQAAELQKAFDEASNDEASTKKALAEAVEARETLKSQRDATDLVLEQARKTEVERAKLTGELAEDSRERIKAAAHAKAQEVFADAQRKVEAASSVLTTKTEAAQAADAILTKAEARLFAYAGDHFG